MLGIFSVVSRQSHRKALLLALWEKGMQGYLRGESFSEEEMLLGI